MLYHVHGKLADASLTSAPHGEFLDRLRKLVLPSLALLNQFQKEGKILAGGVVASSPAVYFILDLPAATSHFEVRRLLLQLPIYSNYLWDVTPLESFQEWNDTQKSYLSTQYILSRARLSFEPAFGAFRAAENSSGT